MLFISLYSTVRIEIVSDKWSTLDNTRVISNTTFYVFMTGKHDMET